MIAHTLPETNIAPANLTRELIFQLLIFRGYVSLPEGKSQRGIITGMSFMQKPPCFSNSEEEKIISNHRTLVLLGPLDLHNVAGTMKTYTRDPETNGSHLKIDGWNTYDGFLIGWPIFRGELLVSGSTSQHCPTW